MAYADPSQSPISAKPAGMPNLIAGVFSGLPFANKVCRQGLDPSGKKTEAKVAAAAGFGHSLGSLHR
jgi:hypothetical protein